MGIQLHEAAAGEATASIHWGGQVINFTFNPNNYTAQAEGEWRTRYLESVPGDVAIAFIQKLVLRWDLMGDVEFRIGNGDPEWGGEEMKDQRLLHTGRIVVSEYPFPLMDFDKMRFVPTALLGAINDEIQRQMIVEKARRQASDDGSAMAELRMIPGGISAARTVPGGTAG